MQRDWDELEIALTTRDPSYDTTYYLDRQTGDITLDADGIPEEEREALSDLMDAEPDRFIEIQPLDTQEEWGWMHGFIGTVSDQRPAERQQWFSFRDARLHEAVETWVKDEGLTPSNPPPWASQPQS